VQWKFKKLFFFLLVGAVGGFLAGLLGVGGGIVFVPLIHVVLEQHHITDDTVNYTLANSLAIVFAVGVTGTMKHLKIKNTHLPSALVTGLFAVITSLYVSYFIYYYQLKNQVVFNGIFAALLILTSIRMLMGMNKKNETPQTLIIPPVKKFIPAGLFAGVVTALSGLGGGIVMVPYFNKILKLPIKFSTGLSLTVIPIIAFPLLIFYSINLPQEVIYPQWQIGHLLLPVIFPVITGAVIASPFGIKVSQKQSDKTITLVFIIFVLLTLIKILVF